MQCTCFLCAYRNSACEVHHHQTPHLFFSLLPLYPLDLSFYKEQNTRSLSVPVVMELIFKNSFQPGDKAQLRAAKELRNGERRVQEACDIQRTAFNECLPDDMCTACYEEAIQAADDQSTKCREMEIYLCASHTTCPCGSGCESEAENLFQCLLQEFTCTNMSNCTDTTCDAEFIAVTNCESNLDISCFTCVGDAIDALFPTEDSTANCNEVEDAVCSALEPCGCENCGDEVRELYSCLGTETCEDFDCVTISCDDEQAAFNACLPDDICRGCYQGAIETAAEDSTLCLQYESRLCGRFTTCPCGVGCESEAEIFYQCLVDQAGCIHTVNCTDTVCEEESNAAADCVADLGDGSCLGCLYDATDPPESTADCNEFEEAVCTSLKTCGCDYCSDKVKEFYTCYYAKTCPDLLLVCDTPFPTMAPTVSSVDVGPCNVCGNPNLTVDSSKMVTIDGDSRPCDKVQEEYSSTQITAFECNVLVDLVEKSCGCQDILPPTVPTTVPPTSLPDREETSSGLAALSALVAIPLLAFILYLIMRKKKKLKSGDIRKASRNSDDPDYEFDETPPVTPTRTTPSSRRNADQSITESSEEDHNMYGHNHGGSARASLNSGGVPPSGNSIQSGGDQSGGTRRSRDPSGVVDYTEPHVSSPAPRPTTGGEYSLQPKDQCRSAPHEDQVPVAYVVDTGEFLAKNQEQKRSSAISNDDGEYSL